MEEKVCVGKLVNTRGLKGEVKVISDFELKDKIFKPGNIVIINGRNYTISHASTFKQFDMITFKEINDINEAEILKGLDIYVNRSSLDMSNDDYLLSDLIGMKVICNGEEIGIVRDYTTSVNPLLEVLYNDKNYYIPLNANYIDHVKRDIKEIYVIDETKGLII